MLELTKIGSILLAIALVLSLNGRWHFMLDNLSSFKVHFAISFLVCCAVFLVARELRWLGFAAVGFLASVLPILNWYLPGPTVLPAGHATAIKVMSVNVSPRNDSPAKLVDLVAEERPEVLGLIELNPEFSERLADIRAAFPYFYEAPEEGFRGLGIYSRIPLRESKIVRFGDELPPAISTIVKIGESGVEFILLHPSPPMTAKLAADRNRQLELVADYVAESEHSTVVLTDLNTAMWSPYYREFVEGSGLRNARNGAGVASTWPPTRLLGVPIDHVFHSDDVLSRDFRVLSDVGSDHLPVVAEVGLIGQMSKDSHIELGSVNDPTERER